jgi:hypothetical protein
MRPATDLFANAGRSAASSGSLAGSALSDRFRFWRGKSGRRFVFSVYALESAPAYAGAVVVAVRTTPSGDVPVWVGAVETVEEAMLMPVLFSGAVDRLHIHLLAGDHRDRQALVEDLGATVARH